MIKDLREKRDQSEAAVVFWNGQCDDLRRRAAARDAEISGLHGTIHDLRGELALIEGNGSLVDARKEVVALKRTLRDAQVVFQMGMECLEEEPKPMAKRRRALIGQDLIDALNE